MGIGCGQPRKIVYRQNFRVIATNRPVHIAQRILAQAKAGSIGEHCVEIGFLWAQNLPGVAYPLGVASVGIEDHPGSTAVGAKPRLARVTCELLGKWKLPGRQERVFKLECSGAQLKTPCDPRHGDWHTAIPAMAMPWPVIPFVSLQSAFERRVWRGAAQHAGVLDMRIERAGLQIAKDAGSRLDRVVRAAEINKPVRRMSARVKQFQRLYSRFDATEVSPFRHNMGIDKSDVSGRVGEKLRVFRKVVMNSYWGMLKHRVELVDQTRGLLDLVKRIDQQDEADWRHFVRNIVT